MYIFSLVTFCSLVYALVYALVYNLAKALGYNLVKALGYALVYSCLHSLVISIVYPVFTTSFNILLTDVWCNFVSSQTDVLARCPRCSFLLSIFLTDLLSWLTDLSCYFVTFLRIDLLVALVD